MPWLAVVFLCSALAGAAPPSPPGGQGEVRVAAAQDAAAAGVEGGEEVVVEASAQPTDPSATSASVTVVPVDARLSSTADVAQVLDGVAGTTVVHLGGLGAFSAVSIRGSSLRQVQVYLDGVPLNPDGSDVVNLAELPLRAFQRVEVWRGNAPPRYAAAPIGGVVDLVTAEEPAAATALTVGQHGTVRAFAMQGFQAPGAGSAGAGQRLDGLVVADLLHTRGDYLFFDDNGTVYDLLDDRLGRRENDDKDQLSTLARLRWGDRRRRLSLLHALVLRDEGLPGHVQAPALDASLATGRHLAVAQAEARSAALAGQARLWTLHRQELLDDRAGELGAGADWLRDRYGTLGLHAHGQWAATAWALPALTLSLRGDQARETDLATGERAPAARRLSGTAALSAELRAWQDRVLVAPVLQGLLLDDRALGADDSRVRTFATPRLGLALRPWRPLTLKANVGRAVRPPDLTELFGDQGAVTGNPDLLPERALAWDLGARLVGPEDSLLVGAIDVAHFWSRTEDMIVLVQNAQRTSTPVNFGLTWVQGLEAAATLDLAGWLDSQTALTWTLSRNLTPDPSVADNQLPRIPTVQLSQATSVHWQERLRLGHDFTWTDGSYWDATNFYRSAPRPLHGAFLRVEPHPAWPSLEASVRNLADRIVQVVPRNPLDPDDDARIVEAITDYAGYPLPGRTWMLTLRWSPAPPGGSP